MSQIKLSHLLITAFLALVLGGCGDKNSKAVYSPESKHTPDWVLTHKISARVDVESCTECHGSDYSGGIANVSCMSQTGPSGFTCHASNPAVNMTGCVSCHGGLPSGPFGTAAPNRKSAHTKHTALTACVTCHENAGSGTAGHAKATTAGGLSKATVALTTYSAAHNSTTGSFGYNTNGTCSQISCHGGKVTPAWTGTISIVAKDNSVCYMCHQSGYTQYNSFNSGTYSGTDPVTPLHTSHLNRGAFCTDCHNIGALTDYQKHFAGIAGKRLTIPGNTIGGSPTKISSYTVSTKTCNTVECHDSNISTIKWVQ